MTKHKEIADLLSSNYHILPEKIPATKRAIDFLERTLHILFPQCKNSSDCNENFIAKLEYDLEVLLEGYGHGDTCSKTAKKFIANLPNIQKILISDAKAIYAGDPAAFSLAEVILAYPGFFAISVHRIAHEFYKDNLQLFSRVLSEHSHKVTGIDIHPGASIDHSFCIDHGTGIVIGETTVIKENVKIYQGVTLGGLSVSKDLAMKKRHPTIEKNVVIYANATILGGDTIIGENCIIGGSVWLTSSVDPNSKVYHKGDIQFK